MTALPCRRCRRLLVALAASASTIVALVAGALARTAGSSFPVSIMTGGGAFATTTIVLLAVIGALGWFGGE